VLRCYQQRYHSVTLQCCLCSTALLFLDLLLSLLRSLLLYLLLSLLLYLLISLFLPLSPSKLLSPLNSSLLLSPLTSITSSTSGIQDQTFDAFLWETFTTKPSCERGEVKKVTQLLSYFIAFHRFYHIDDFYYTTIIE
jgi:hypothetical protein